MAIIRREKKWVYDYVSVCYKGLMQATCYMSIVYRMETHDMASVDDRTGRVAGGDFLDDDYNQCILPPLNPRKRGRPQSKRRELQMQGIRTKRCSKYCEVGHYKNICRSP